MTEDPDTIRGALDELSWSLLDVTLQAAPTQALARSAAFADPHRHGLSAEHQRLLAAIRRDGPGATQCSQAAARNTDRPAVGAAPSPAARIAVTRHNARGPASGGCHQA